MVWRKVLFLAQARQQTSLMMWNILLTWNIPTKIMLQSFVIENPDRKVPTAKGDCTTLGYFA